MKSWPWRERVGYLRVVEIALLHSRRWAGTLVVTAAASVIAGSASPAAAQAGGAGPAPAPTIEAKPLAAAGWHGQSIRHPYEARSSQPTTAQPPDGAAMRLGAGFGQAERSAPVRRIQRMLRGLGYECGPPPGPLAAKARRAARVVRGTWRRARRRRRGARHEHARWAPAGGPAPRGGAKRGRARCAAHGTEAPTSPYSQRIPRQTGRTDRGPMASQAPATLIGPTR